MSRPCKLIIESSALLHNLNQVRRFAPGKKIIAMVKANAYGCGIHNVAPVLEGQVDAFGVACLEEALILRAMGIRTHCILFQGIFQPEELKVIAERDIAIVLHQTRQLQWLLEVTLSKAIKVWVKVNTGMNRLGFNIAEVPKIMNALQQCSAVNPDIGLMSHLACADEPDRIENRQQITLFNHISVPGFTERSLANSAALIALPQTHEDAVRPGIMLYGVSPFSGQTARDLGLRPVMRFMSAISAIHSVPPFAQVGYQGIWSTNKPSVIGIVAAGYGDGYPRHIAANTPVGIRGKEVSVVGRVSMDSLAVDLTSCPEVRTGDPVELWGEHILIEHIAQSAGTIAYELLCQMTNRVRYG